MKLGNGMQGTVHVTTYPFGWLEQAKTVSLPGFEILPVSPAHQKSRDLQRRFEAENRGGFERRRDVSNVAPRKPAIGKGFGWRPGASGRPGIGPPSESLRRKNPREALSSSPSMGI